MREDFGLEPGEARKRRRRRSTREKEHIWGYGFQGRRYEIGCILT